MLEEIAQSDERSRTRLNLVEEEQIAPRSDAPTQEQLELSQNARRLQVGLEHAVPVAPPLQVDDVDGIEAVTAELGYGRRLADLPRTAHDQRFAPRRLLPRLELLVTRRLMGAILPRSR